MADILSNIPEEGIKKTALAYRSRTDYRVFLRYLQLMIREGLVRYDEKQGKVYITDRGRWFLQQWKGIRELMREALRLNTP